MRRPLIAGNWKMNLTRSEAVALAEAVAKQADQYPTVDIAVCPPFVYLEAVGRAIAGSRVALGAQNMYPEPSGAFTGEISPMMLCEMGCRYVILGHSERRQWLGETDSFINKKVHAALKAGLQPIVCLGEQLAEREAGHTLEVIRAQFEGSLAGLTAQQMIQTVIAYEPVWAIGTGKVATPHQAEEVHLELRKLIAQRYNPEIAQQVVIQYGGSVKPDNAQELFAQPDIDGALVGGASLKPDQFLGIIAGMKK
ncbi:MAG: triose-phosphate isomerase [Thermoguttaceae bacterium]|nr:triose-phosphate isomerase [Thermoguttaceae bacterium]MDW8037525.1 triose-phosphate isomerase [Thermoguttaceae bacterium]